MQRLYKTMTFTVRSAYSSIYSEQLESMPIGLIEWTYGKPMAVSSGCGRGVGGGGHDRGVVVGGIEGRGIIEGSG